MLSEARSEILGVGKANRPKQRREGFAPRHGCTPIVIRCRVGFNENYCLVHEDWKVVCALPFM
jgi:hypothetical protein